VFFVTSDGNSLSGKGLDSAFSVRVGSVFYQKVGVGLKSFREAGHNVALLLTVASNPSARMLFGTLLPACCKSEVACVLSGHDLIDAGSWKELGALAQTGNLTGVLADPRFDDGQGVNRAAEFLRTHPLLPTIGFFTLSGANLRTALLLAKQGLREAYIYPLASRHLHQRRLVDTLASPAPVAIFLNLIEPSFGRLPPNASRTIQDLFLRPGRYNCAEELAIECRLGVRQLYRRLEDAHLGSPKKLLLAAKLLRGAHYLMNRHVPVKEVSDKLGYENPRAFAKHTLAVFGCNPTDLRTHTDEEEIVKHVLEWLTKPSTLARRGPVPRPRPRESQLAS
jgi:AraC-like DNA-binding protein